MAEPTRFQRRTRVNEPAAIAIGVAGGVLTALGGARPTGSAAVDVAMVVLLSAAVIWASATAPWWAVTAAAGFAAVVAVDPILTMVGAIGFALGMWVGVRRRDLSEIRAVIAAIAVNVLARSELGGVQGLSAIAAVAVCCALFALGLQRRSSRVRRPAWIAVAAVGVVVIVGAVVAGIAALRARPDLTAGNQHARRAITALNDGDYLGAAALFDQAASAFARSEEALGSAFVAPALLVPGISQNLDAGAAISATAADAVATAADALRQVDPDTLRMREGAIDLAAIAAVEAPLVEVQGALSGLRGTVDDLDSPWLLGKVQTELAELDADLDEQEPRIANAIDAVRLAPGLLGADGARNYLVLFTSPAEVRGLGGFVGNYAVVTADHGRIDVGDFARRSELQLAAIANGASCPGCPDEWVERYARFRVLTAARDVDVAFWQNFNMSADLPYSALVAQEMFPQSGGPEIDGVIVMDPYVVQALMQYTGPIEVPELGVTVEPDEAAKFVLEDQYVLQGDGSQDDRIEASETLGEEAIRRLLAGTLPSPHDLASDLAPLVDERRLLLWTDRPDEQALLEQVGLLGNLPELGTDGGFAVVLNNRGGSKIDVFLEREIELHNVVDDAGNRQTMATVTLTNHAPDSGLPRYVLGNVEEDLPPGTSRLFVTFYGPPTLNSAMISAANSADSPVDLEPLPEAGWTAFGTEIELGPGESVTYSLVFDIGPVAPGLPAGDPATWLQPLARR